MKELLEILNISKLSWVILANIVSILNCYIKFIDLCDSKE